MFRKKAERKKRCPCPAEMENTSAFFGREPEDSATLLGVLSFVSGVSDSEEIFKVAEKCRRHGMDLRLGLNPEKKLDISSRSLEVKKQYSSRSLCT